MTIKNKQAYITHGYTFINYRWGCPRCSSTCSCLQTMNFCIGLGKYVGKNPYSMPWLLKYKISEFATPRHNILQHYEVTGLKNVEFIRCLGLAMFYCSMKFRYKILLSPKSKFNVRFRYLLFQRISPFSIQAYITLISFCTKNNNYRLFVIGRLKKVSSFSCLLCNTFDCNTLIAWT